MLEVRDGHDVHWRPRPHPCVQQESVRKELDAECARVMAVMDPIKVGHLITP